MHTRGGHAPAARHRSWCISAIGTLSPSIESTSSRSYRSAYRVNLMSASPSGGRPSSAARSTRPAAASHANETGSR